MRRSKSSSRPISPSATMMSRFLRICRGVGGPRRNLRVDCRQGAVQADESRPRLSREMARGAVNSTGRGKRNAGPIAAPSLAATRLQERRSADAAEGGAGGRRRDRRRFGIVAAALGRRRPRSSRLDVAAERLDRRGLVGAVRAQHDFVVLFDAEQHQLDRALGVARLAAANDLDVGGETACSLTNRAAGRACSPSAIAPRPFVQTRHVSFSRRGRRRRHGASLRLRETPPRIVFRAGSRCGRRRSR